jgi:hypothetical protein
MRNALECLRKLDFSKTKFKIRFPDISFFEISFRLIPSNKFGSRRIRYLRRHYLFNYTFKLPFPYSTERCVRLYQLRCCASFALGFMVISGAEVILGWIAIFETPSVI